MILVTHWDADGIFSIYYMYKKFGDTFKVYFSGPRVIIRTLLNIIKENDKNEEIYIVDIAPNQEAIYLSSYFKKVYWIDHHITENLETTSRTFLYIKNYKSAAHVLAEFLNIRDNYINFIDNIDSNNIQTDLERDFRDLVVGIKYYYPKDYPIHFISIAKELYMGKKIEEIIEKRLKILSDFKKFLKSIEDYIILNTQYYKGKSGEFLVTKVDFNIPSFYIVEKLKEKIKKDIDYIIVLYEKDKRGEIRTLTNKNVLEIAKKLNGGGHMFAAGFQYNSPEEVIETIKEI